MKLAIFNDNRLGAVDGEYISDVTSVVEGLAVNPGTRMNRIIERWDEFKPKLEKAASTVQRVPIRNVQLRAPLPRPGKIVCMAVNYMENGTRAAPAPINAFVKARSSIIGPGETIILPPDQANIFEHEAELGLVVGKTAKNVKAEDAYNYIFGYVNFIDGSIRGLGSPGTDNFFTGKSYHTFGPQGPMVVTADEIADPLKLNVKLWVNGVLRQTYNTSDMAHKIPRVIEWMSSITTLEPGDIIPLGTNHIGLGPLQDGDVVDMEIDGLGRLSGLRVRDDAKRSWPWETRGQAAARQAAAGGAAH